LDFTKVCSEIFKIDPKVRYVAVFNDSAKQIAGGMREGEQPYLPQSLTKMSIDQSIIRWKSRLELKDWIGLPKYAFTEYEKIKRYTIYLDTGNLLAISTEIDLDTMILINKVYKILGMKL
jgi:hypothetical protein